MPKGSKIVSIAQARLGDAYVLGSLAPKNNPDWTGPWDCAEFASWCVYQASKMLFGCQRNDGDPASADAYTGYWQRDAQKNTCSVPVSIAAATSGAMLLRYPHPNLVGHIAISDGCGGTIEAHSSKTGVIRSVVSGRRWDCGVLVPGIDYSDDLPNDPNKYLQRIKPVPGAGLVLRLKVPPMRGELIAKVQAALELRGFSPGKIDGKYGPKTMAAVSAFQLTEGLVPDGEVGKVTFEKLGIVRAVN